MCDFPEKYTNLPKWSCVLNVCSECPIFFVTDAENNYEYDLDIPFIWYHHYKSISSCSFHKQLFPEHFKTCPSCINIENVEKGKVTKWKILVLKSCIILDLCSEYYIPAIEQLDFHFPYVYILGKNHCAGKRHDMFVSRRNKIDCKCTRDYTERCQVLIEQIHSQHVLVIRPLINLWAEGSVY